MAHNRLRDLIISTEEEFHLSELIPFFETDKDVEEVKKAISMGEILIKQFHSLPLASKLAILVAFAKSDKVSQTANNIISGAVAIEKKDNEAIAKLKSTIVGVGLLLTIAIIAHAIIPELMDEATHAVLVDTIKVIIGIE